jgi:histidine triad (HIT) family protein
VAACTFCRILAGEVPAHFAFRDDRYAAFLDHRPLFPGHVLVVPVEHHEVLADLPAALLPGYFTLVQSLTTAVEAACAAAGSFVAENNRVSQSVPHLHTHVVPRTKGDGLRGFFWPRTTYADDGAMAATAAAIGAALAAPA